MKSLKGTRTEKNLLTAFAGESKLGTAIATLLHRQRRRVTSK
jgi:hypothetical protein